MAVEIMIVAGEASGDLHAGRLVAELAARHPHWRFFGCGGENLRAAGCELLVNATDLAVVGLFEVAAHLPRIYGRYRSLVAAMRQRRPACVVLVDFPDFNLRLARAAARLGLPVAYFISPQLWAWRSRRVEIIRRAVRRMICIFPFEPAFYAGHGLKVDYVGHPLLDVVLDPARPQRSAEEFFRRHALAADRPLIALLPGSRRREVAFNFPPLLAAAARLRSERNAQFLVPAASTLDPKELAGLIPAELRPDARVIAGETYDLLAHARLALVASGTATLEAALLRTPMVVVYRLSPWTYRLGRRWVRAPHFAMANLIADRRAAPELIQDEFTSEAVVDWALKLLDDASARRAMQSSWDEVRARLGPPGAIARAANIVEEIVPGSGAEGVAPIAPERASDGAGGQVSAPAPF